MRDNSRISKELRNNVSLMLGKARLSCTDSYKSIVTRLTNRKAISLATYMVMGRNPVHCFEKATSPNAINLKTIKINIKKH